MSPPHLVRRALRVALLVATTLPFLPLAGTAEDAVRAAAGRSDPTPTAAAQATPSAPPCPSAGPNQPRC